MDQTYPVTQDPRRVTLTVEEAACELGISRSLAYEAVRQGEIPSIRVGRRILVPRHAFELMLGGEHRPVSALNDGAREFEDIA
jgi:excisionase family DNA binding protein